MRDRYEALASYAYYLEQYNDDCYGVTCAVLYKERDLNGACLVIGVYHA